MELPEFALLVCRKGGGGSFFRKLVFGKWKVFVNELHILRVFVQHLLEQRLKPRAVRSLVVTENGEGNRGMFRP